MNNISKVFRTDLIETHALRDFSLEVKAGEFLAVTGPSGSGKTTFLNIAGLLETYDTGSYKLDDVEVTELSDDARSRLRNQKIGFIFQSFNLMPDLNIYDNVDVPLRYRRMKAAERNKRITNALEIVGLAARMKHMPSQLSGGQQQRVAIARAIAGDPKLVLADEPTGNLDSLMARQVMDLLEQINEMGTTIIMVTHDPELARRAHRNVHVVDGQISDFKPYEPHAARDAGHGDADASPRPEPEMFAYYLRLALASFRRNPGLTALMVFAIALGISVCMITLTSYRAAAGNPAGDRSGILFAPSIDSWDPENAVRRQTTRRSRPTMLTYRDARALLRLGYPGPQGHHVQGRRHLSAAPTRAWSPQYFATRMTTADFFAMFDVPFLYGGPWDAKADAGPEPVIVLSKETNQKAFGGANSVGKTVLWHDREFRVVGVLDDWEPMPKYFDVSNGSFQRHGGRIHAVRLGPGARARQPRQHQLLEDRGHRQLPGVPQFGVHLDPRVVRAAHRRAAARLPRVPRQLRHRTEEARPLSAPAQQLPLRRRTAGSSATRSSATTTRPCWCWRSHSSRCAWSTPWACCSRSS